MSRKPIQQEVEASVLVKSRRRCCICFGLNRDTALKSGQIAHLDQNSANPSEDNLAFLCFEHHNQYDSTTRQSKNLTAQEIKTFRSELHQAIEQAFGATVAFGNATASLDPVAGHYVSASAYQSSDIHVKRLSGGMFHVTGTALYGLKRELGPNMGELDFVAPLHEGLLEFKAPRHSGEPYRVAFVFGGPRLIVEEENVSGVHGIGVTFKGEYEKAT